MKGDFVTLKPLSDDDFIIVTQWNYDPIVTEFFSERDTPDLEKQLKWFQSQLDAKDKKKFIIICNAKKTKIGLISLMKIDLNNHHCEIGITIGNTDYWGKPHAKEAFRLMLEYCFKTLAMNMVYLTVFENNIRAIKFFHKMGLQKDGIFRQAIFKNEKYISLQLMSIQAKEFENRK